MGRGWAPRDRAVLPSGCHSDVLSVLENRADAGPADARPVCARRADCGTLSPGDGRSVARRRLAAGGRFDASFGAPAG